MVDELFAKFHGQLAMHGYVARAGQMIDATFVEVPRQRNTREETLVADGFESQIHEKGTRARVEHVFGAQHAMGGHIVRTIGLARAKVKIGMMNLVYNMKRLGQLIKRDVRAANLRYDNIRRGVSAVA